MGDCLHAVHTEGNQTAGPDTEHTQGSTQDPGHGAALRLGARSEGYYRGEFCTWLYIPLSIRTPYLHPQNRQNILQKGIFPQKIPQLS